MLTGTALKETVDALTAQGKTRSEIAIACGYCTVEGNNTKIHFTDFYMALLEVKKSMTSKRRRLRQRILTIKRQLMPLLRITLPKQLLPSLNFMGRRMLSILKMLIRENTNQAHTMQNHWFLIATA